MTDGGRGPGSGPLPASPARAVVVTGGSGFVGRHLLAALAREAPAPRVLLVRRSDRPITLPREAAAWSWEQTTLDLAGGTPAGSSRDWPEGATVIHLAAATGRAPRERHWAVNVEATRRLLAIARQRAASHVLFVSSVAAGYADRRWYHYAETKREAEALVIASGLPWTIVRPTMVFGPGSPNQQALAALASAPWPIIFGRGTSMVQPIHVQDLATALARLSATGPLRQVVPLGGRDRVTLGELLRQLRRRRGQTERPAIPIPVPPLRLALGVLEPLLGRWLPVTAGQLAAFVNDAVAERSDAAAALLPAPLGLAEMLAADGDDRR